jgi:hypothetical protein
MPYERPRLSQVAMTTRSLDQLTDEEFFQAWDGLSIAVALKGIRQCAHSLDNRLFQCRRFLVWRAGHASNGSRRAKARSRVDATVVPNVRRQRGAAPASCARLFQMAEVAIARQMFQEILRLIPPAARVWLPGKLEIATIHASSGVIRGIPVKNDLSAIRANRKRAFAQSPADLHVACSHVNATSRVLTPNLSRCQRQSPVGRQSSC